MQSQNWGWGGNAWHWLDSNGNEKDTGTLVSGYSGSAELCIPANENCYTFFVDSAGSNPWTSNGNYYYYYYYYYGNNDGDDSPSTWLTWTITSGNGNFGTTLSSKQMHESPTGVDPVKPLLRNMHRYE